MLFRGCSASSGFGVSPRFEGTVMMSSAVVIITATQTVANVLIPGSCAGAPRARPAAVSTSGAAVAYAPPIVSALVHA